MIQWLLNGAGVNKTTVAAIAGFIGGLGLIFTGNFNEGALLVIASVQQLTIRWANTGFVAVLFQRTFWAALGGVCTGAYMVYNGTLQEGFALIMISIQALFQRQAKAKI